MENTKPSSIPHGLLSVHTAEENTSPRGVGVTSDRIASHTETEVDAALLLPHFLMRAPPRVETRGTKTSSHHAWAAATLPLNDPDSASTSRADRAPIRAFTKSGTCVVEWFPQMMAR